VDQSYASVVNKRLILVISILAVPVIAVLPRVWRWSPAVAWLFGLAICVWSVWLMVLYLKWARQLGNTSPGEPPMHI